jgi:hypothetical protein
VNLLQFILDFFLAKTKKSLQIIKPKNIHPIFDGKNWGIKFEKKMFKYFFQFFLKGVRKQPVRVSEGKHWVDTWGLNPFRLLTFNRLNAPVFYK